MNYDYNKGMSEPFLYRILRPIGIIVMFGFYNLKIENKEVIPKQGSVVIAGNHKDYFDPLCVDAATRRTVYALCFETYYYAHEWFFKNVGSIPVKEKHGKEALVAAIDHLNQGCIINISPEGQMNKSDELLLPFKKGMAIMAKETNSKIIPYSITGDYKFRSRNLKICFGEPIDVSGMEVEEITALVYKKVEELLLKNR